MLLIKFGEEKWINKLKDGEIFMRPISDYRKLEEEQKKKGQGDKYEGKLYIKQKMNCNFFGLYIEMNSLEFGIDGDEKNLIGCFYNVDPNRMKLIDNSDDKLSYIFEFNELEKKEFSKWGDIALLIDKLIFLEKVGEEFKKSNIDAIGRKVEYYNTELPYIEVIEKYNQSDIERVLYKDNYFKNQNEFRIITNIQEDEGKTIINIGDISNISETHKIENILEEGFTFTIYKK